MYPMSGDTVLPDWCTGASTVAEIQSNVVVSNGQSKAVTGSLAFIEGGLSPAGYLAGDGHFMMLGFNVENGDFDAYSAITVELDPSQGAGPQDILSDPDKNCIFKITSTSQKIKIVATLADTNEVQTTEYSLTGLTLEEQPVPPVEGHAYYFVNGDGDFGFTLQPATALSDTGTVAIEFSDDITGYDSYAVMEYPEGGGSEQKTSTSITGGTVTFTDIDVSSTGPYIVTFYDDNNTRIPASTFVTNNVIPSHATITQSSETVFSADITQAGD